MEGYYFYNGFYPPKKIDMDDIVLTDNYRGDVTEEMLETHRLYVNLSDEDYNAGMNEYNISRNPCPVDFLVENRKWFDKQTIAANLGSYFDRMDILDDGEMSDYAHTTAENRGDFDEDEECLFEYEIAAANMGYERIEELALWVRDKEKKEVKLL